MTRFVFTWLKNELLSKINFCVYLKDEKSLMLLLNKSEKFIMSKNHISTYKVKQNVRADMQQHFRHWFEHNQQ